jgi:FlaA1/EpsC-like NDP-sugar epimerase
MALLDAAVEAGVDRFVLVSTDKAVKPSSVMGASKRVAEMLVADTARRTGRPYVSVRFGNVLGSNGSVVPIFTDQLERGRPLTITHPDMTRYFMTIPEATQLVLQAGVMGSDGDIFVLDMGEPVRIIDLARRMIELSGHEPGRDIAIEVVGIRPGEKLHEELFNVDEEVRPTRYGKVMRATRPPLDAEQFARGLDRLFQHVSAGGSQPVADALWSALRGGRGPAADGEAPVAPTPTTELEHP